MSFCNSRRALIKSLEDGHVVANLTIDYRVDKQDSDHTLTVDLHLSGEKGKHDTHFCMRRDVYYNLPQKINIWLKSYGLAGSEFSAPLCANSVIHAPLALDMLSEIHSELGPEQKVDLDRFLSDHY